MQHKEFVTAYQPTMTPYHISDRYAHAVHEHQGWSLQLGEALHTALTQGDLVSQELIAQYDTWNTRSYAKNAAVIKSVAGNFEEESSAYTDLHFHELNAAMIDMWRPLFSPPTEWNAAERRDAINNAQGLLAVSGVKHSMLRHKIVKEFGTEDLFGQNTPAHAPFRALTGRMQELDAAIVLLEVARRRQELTVIPAPLQFRAGPERGLNANFLVLDTTTNDIAGVRIRPRVMPKDLETADHSRIMFIDGITDLGNVKSVRIKKGSSQEKAIPWPGLISAKQMQRIKMHGAGKVAGAASEHTSQMTLQYKMEARALLGKTRVDFADLSTKVGERILAKLHPDSSS